MVEVIPSREELSTGSYSASELSCNVSFEGLAARTEDFSESATDSGYPSKISPPLPPGPPSAKAKEMSNFRKKFRSHSDPNLDVLCDPYGVMQQEVRSGARRKPSDAPVKQSGAEVLQQEVVSSKETVWRKKLNAGDGKYASSETISYSGAPEEKERVDLMKMQLDRKELKMGELVGSGTSAEVFKGKWRGKTVAIKQFVTQSQNRRMQLKQEIAILRETEAIATISHENLVKFHGLAFEQQPFLLISEFCSGGTVFDLLYENDEIELQTEQQLKMCCDVAWAMLYLHGFKPQIIHRDLKSLNLLLFEPVTSTEDIPHVKVSDFGFCKMREECAEWGKMTRGLVGCWMAPEAAMGEYTEKADVYSFAMVLFELISQELPFADVDDCDVMRLAAKGERPDMEAVPPDTPANLVDLMESCWAPKPGDRPSFGLICNTLSEIVSEVLD